MDELQKIINAAAAAYLERKLSIIPLGQGKSPAIKWMDYIDKTLGKWDFPRCNIALLTGEFNNLIVVDCDSEESYIGWLKTKTPTPLRVKTKRGMQFYYQHPGQYIKSAANLVDSSGFKYDIKGDRSYVVAAPSLRSGFQYQVCVCTGNIRGRLLPFEQLPKFDPAWRPDTVSAGTSAASTKKVRDGVKYISHIYAVSGSNGDQETYRAACRLVESGMDKTEAFVAMLDWNKTNATPPWTERELLYKVQRAIEGK